MTKVLYISNIEVPYRTVFFNQLSERCDLTVLYERKRSSNRDKNWTRSINKSYGVEFLGGLKISNEYSFSLRIFKWLLHDFDCYVVGCYNSPVQILAVFFLKAIGKKVIISNDGEYFFAKGFKSKIKKWIFSQADIILTAGKTSAKMFGKLFPDTRVFSYFFSSLTEEEISCNSQASCNRMDYILVIGQYFAYKGMDIAVKLALKYPSLRFKFIGTGYKAETFIDEQRTSSLSNVEVIPFMDKETLAQEYKRCQAMVLPSRNECWGLVVNEAASFGTPIVSTHGSGAAVEYLLDDYPDFLAEYCGDKDSDVDSLAKSLKQFLECDNKDGYSDFLKKKSKEYSIEKMVSVHLEAIHALTYESSDSK